MRNVFIISAPSGSGKSTLLRRALAADDRLLFSISYTTRSLRGAEKAGESYHYIPRAEFEELAGRGEFLEWAEVFGNYYGTHRRYYERAHESGKDLVLDIDVQGARQLRGKIPDAISIFILAPSREILEQRLRARSEDRDEVIARRLREAAEEIRNYHDYDYVLVNREVERSAADLAAIFRVERLRRTRMEDEIKPILASFAESTPEESRLTS